MGYVGWGVLATAALVAAVVLWTGSGDRARPKTAEKLGRADRELAVAWSQTRSELAIASDADFWFPAHLNSSESGQLDAANDDTRDDLLDDSLMGPTPDWLMAAVEGYSPADEDVDPAEPADRGELTPFDDERTEN